MKGKKSTAHVAPLRRKRRSPLKSAFLFLLLMTFVGGGLYFGMIFLINARFMLGSLGQRFDLPLPIVGSSDNAPNWGSKGRVNILLLGIDQRLDEKDQPTRSDTMLVLTIDPETKSAGMLSIPRDMWVPIPLGEKGTVQAKITTAHFYGDYYNLDGGGPGLAKRTVQYNLGVKIHYYAKVDFEGFEKIVDTLGGVNVDVEVPLKDDEYPTPDYGYRRVFIPAGLQHLDGEMALQFARSRHQDSDFGRTKRQQKVLLGMRERAVQLDLLSKLPKLIREFGDTVKTDMSPSEIIALARLGKEIDTSNMVMRTIEYPAVTPLESEAGDILVPVRPEIAKIVAEVFFDPKLKAENAKIDVVNGTRTAGLATKVAEILQGHGLSQVEIDTLNGRQEAQSTTIVSYKSKSYTTKQIAAWLSIPDANIQWKDDSQSEFDIQVIIGKDLKIPSN